MNLTPPTSNPPSRKRTRTVIVALILLCVLASAWLIWPAPEPTYNGKPFTLWLEEYTQLNRSGKLDEEHRQAMQALTQMGAKAIPIIIRTLEKSDSPMRNKYREVWPTLPDWTKKVLPRPNPETFSVFDACYPLLLVPATNAVPQLHRLARSHNPALREVAFQDIFCRFNSYAQLFPKEDLLPLCVSALNDPSASVRMHAASAIGYFGPAASNAVPALIGVLQGSEAARKGGTSACRAAAASALGRIGPAAASSIPALTNLLPSANTYLRVQIASAIWHITSDESLALPILISDIPNLELHFKHAGPLHTLTEMGPRAKPAIPMLLKELTNTKNNSHTFGLVSNALQAIDPEVAAKTAVK